MILITGGTGTVGRELVRQLATRGEKFRVLTRSMEKTRALPNGVEGVVADLAQPSTLDSAMRGVDRLFLLTALSQTEVEEGVNAIKAARAAGVRRIVYMSVHNVEAAPHIPHFKTKIEIQKALAESAIAHTLIMPNSFFQNDLWFRDAIAGGGVYPQPIGSVGLNSVDVRDIAEAAIAALTKIEHDGQHYPLVGPDCLTGEAIAQVWSDALGKKVRYGGDDLDAWEQQAQKIMPAWLVHDLKIMYRFFQEHGLRASGDDLARCERILGHAPRRFMDFATETARSWK